MKMGRLNLIIIFLKINPTISPGPSFIFGSTFLSHKVQYLIITYHLYHIILLEIIVKFKKFTNLVLVRSPLSWGDVDRQSGKNIDKYMNRTKKNTTTKTLRPRSFSLRCAMNMNLSVFVVKPI